MLGNRGTYKPAISKEKYEERKINCTSKSPHCIEEKLTRWEEGWGCIR